MYSLLNIGMFHCHVSLPECNIGDIPTMVVRVDYGEIPLKQGDPSFPRIPGGGPDVCLGIKQLSVWWGPSLVLI